jgi:predicted 3-demethylubiquinone-9 3-methyltransferase (glyoxalase superfamily)
MVVAFELDGQPFTALNAGPQFKFTEAISLVINCEDQAAVDHYWDRLTSDGGKTVACGWLKDRCGLCWQVIPAEVFEMLADADRDSAARAHGAVMQMVKLDPAEIRRAYAR